MRSLAREVKRKNKFAPEIILKYAINRRGYKLVVLYRDKTRVGYAIHTLVWDAFGDKKRNGRKLQVDHIDNNKLNNRIDNLQLLTNRENVSKGVLHNGKKTSKYLGVSLNTKRKKWLAQIKINGNTKFLGYFDNEYKAHLRYQKAIQSLKQNKT